MHLNVYVYEHFLDYLMYLFRALCFLKLIYVLFKVPFYTYLLELYYSVANRPLLVFIKIDKAEYTKIHQHEPEFKRAVKYF